MLILNIKNTNELKGSILNKNTLKYLFKKMINNSIKHTIKNNYSLFDIAANLCDEKFQGVYNGKKYHEDDTDEVILRAKDYGVNKMLFASGSIEDLHCSYILSHKSPDFYTTLGIHPCRASVIVNNIKIKVGTIQKKILY